jgi:cytochrome c biogenesis protein CcdA
MITLLFFVFLAGMMTALSLCVLPVLPAILSANQEKWRSIAIVMGLVVSFSFFTLILTVLVQNFGFSANFLRTFAILIIGFLGLALIFPYFSNRLTISTASIIALQPKGGSIASGLLLGAMLGLTWAPFVGPILAAITALIATQKITMGIVLLTLAYSLGASLPLLALAYGSSHFLKNVPLFARYTQRIRQGFGWLLLIAAIALAFDLDRTFQQGVLDYLPHIQMDDNIEQELKKLKPPPVNFPSN